jgi:hypothetical protein
MLWNNFQEKSIENITRYLRSEGQKYKGNVAAVRSLKIYGEV